MLEKVLSISGKSGLYKLLSASRNVFIVESLQTKERMPVYAQDKVISLNDISMYTDDEDIPLRDVFTKLYEARKGKTVDLDLKKATKEQLQEILASALPNFDRERVHNSDIVKLVKWYNVLVEAGYSSFEEDKEEEETAAEEKAEPEAPAKAEAQNADAEEVKKPKKTTAKKAKPVAAKK